jgi:hypothetical protein
METYRIVGACGGRERVVASGLDRERAEAERERMLRNRLGFVRMAFWIEAEDAEAAEGCTANRQLAG